MSTLLMDCFYRCRFLKTNLFYPPQRTHQSMNRKGENSHKIDRLSFFPFTSALCLNAMHSKKVWLGKNVFWNDANVLDQVLQMNK